LLQAERDAIDERIAEVQRGDFGVLDLAVPDPAINPVNAELLTTDECAALDLLQREGLRPEQERLPIAAALQQLGDRAKRR